MAYLVLARKWRPKNFKQLCGQPLVTQALVNALKHEKLHHAYLFSGTRGVGKTSIARILAKSLNCELGITPEPCGQCRACSEIDMGRFADLIEVDGASRTRVEDTRDLLENVQYQPTVGRFKIYLIDEVHMLSGHSFNALLKTLEEPPAHVKFIFATTEPERIPITIRSRCMRFQLVPIPQEIIVEQVRHILNQENIAFEEMAIQQLAKAGEGSLRDTLSLLEQVLAYDDQQITLAGTKTLLGLQYESEMPDLVQAILISDANKALQQLHRMTELGADFTKVLRTLTQIFHAFALLQIAPNLQQALQVVNALDMALLDKVNIASAERLQLLYEIALRGLQQLSLAPTALMAVEMTVLRMIAFQPVQEPWQVQVKEAGVEKASSLAISSEPLPAHVKATMPTPMVQEMHTASVKTVAKTPANKDALDWAQTVANLSLTGLSAALVKNAVLKSFDGVLLQLVVDKEQQACLTPAREKQIEEALRQYLQKPIQLNILGGETQGQSPLQQAQRAKEAYVIETHKKLSEDEAVQAILSTFQATIEKTTVHDK